MDVTKGVNNQNRTNPWKRNKAGLLGVAAQGSRFYAYIRARPGERQIRLGVFKTAQEAHEAYLAAKRKYHPTSHLGSIQP